MKIQSVNKTVKQVQLLLPFPKKKPVKTQLTFRFPKAKKNKKLDKLV